MHRRLGRVVHRQMCRGAFVLVSILALTLATVAPMSAVDGTERDATPAAPPVAGSFILEPLGDREWRMDEDGAGHDASDLPAHPKWLYKLKAAPDGTVWLPMDDALLALGRPGVVDNPIGPGALELEFEADGTLWIRNGAVAAGGRVLLDGRDRAYPRATEMAPHPDGGMVVTIAYDDHNEVRWMQADSTDLGERLAPPLPSDHPDWRLISPTITPDGTVWVIEMRPRYDHQTSEPSRLWRSDGSAWQLVDLPEGSTEVGAVALTPSGRLMALLQGPGDERWLASLDPDGTWSLRPRRDGRIPREWGWLVGATDEAAWFTTGSDCRGVVEVRPQSERHFLRGVCVWSVSLGPDGTVWVAGSDTPAGSAILDPQLYAVTPASVPG